MTRYTPEFYRAQCEGSRRSADAIVPIVLELIQPRSVVDVGCGLGMWLSVFLERGIRDVWGVDGPHVDPGLLRIPADRFQAADLRQSFRLGRRFDLVVSMEVAEHLPEEHAAAFVESLVALGPVVLFSAAIPHQGGEGHVNEQWPAYWAERFHEHGFVALDVVRPRVWHDDSVDWWYAQNTLLYAARPSVERDPRLRAAWQLTPDRPPALVHPRKYLSVIDWIHLVGAMRRDLARVVPPGAPIILVDDEQVRDHVAPGALSFTDQNGQYVPPPPDDATALRALERLQAQGAGFIAFAQPAFWWLEHYREFHRRLRASFRCVLENERLVVFDLRTTRTQGPPPDRA